MGKQSQKRRAQRKGERNYGGVNFETRGTYALGQCYLCLRWVYESDVVSRMVIPGQMAVDLCGRCAAEMRAEYHPIEHDLR